MSAVDDEAQGANAVMSRAVTPFRHAKNLPEAISLTSTPRKIFSTDVSGADGADTRSCESRRSPMSPSRISSEVYTSSRRTGSRRHSSSSEAQAAATCGLGDESDLVSIARCKMDATAFLHAPIAKMKIRKTVDAPAVKHLPPPSASFKRPPRSFSSHAPRKAQPATARVPGTQADTATASSPFSFLKRFSEESAQPPSDLSLQTASPLLQVNKTPRSRQSPVTRPKSDMSSVARSNIHLSVLADLLDKKVFSEEDVLLELEAIRKRSLLTSAPFNNRLLPILAWYLLRDKFGDEAATRYVSLLTSPTDALRPAGAVSATFSIASFLPRVNEIRRMRREAKERNRKKPKHHYAIAAPSSPTDRAKMSHATHAHRQRRRRRRTAAFDALKDASDIPTTSAASPCSPQLSNMPISLCLHNLSPQPYGRLRVYTREHAFFDRQQAKAEDRPVIDVVVDPADRQARAKNTFELIEEEPSIFLVPEQGPSAAKGLAADSTSKKPVPVPPASARSHGALGEAMAHRRHGMQLREGEGCDVLEETLSMGTLSEVGRAREGEEELSLFYRECVEGSGQECMPSVSAFWQAITPCHPSAASYPHSRRGSPARHPQHRQADRDAGVMDVTAAVMPCVSNMLAAADCGANAQRGERASETINSPDLSTVAGDTTRAEVSVEYSLGVADEHQLYNDDASAAPQGGAASQAPTNTTTRSALNGLHKPLGGAYAAGNDTDSASCPATSPSLRDWSAAQTASLCAPEPNQTLKRQHEQQPYSYLSSAENSLNHSVTATQYYSMLPNASAVTHKPGCSLRSCREARQVNGSAELTIRPHTIKPEGSVEKSFGYGGLLEDRADTVETSETESVTSTESADSGSCAAVEYSAFISAETSAMVPPVTSGVQSSATKPNERHPRRAAAAARSMLEHSSHMANPASQGTRRVRGTSPISISRIWKSGLHSGGGGGSKANTRGRTETESGLCGTPAYRMFDSRCPPPTTISGPTYAASASSGKSCFGSLLETDVETSTVGGSDHQRGSLLQPFDSVTLREAAAYRGSARQVDYNVDADDSLRSRNAHRSSVIEHSSNQDRQYKHSLQDCASPPLTPGARRPRSALHDQLRTSRGAQASCTPLDVRASPLAHSPGVYDQRTDALTPHSAAARTPSFGRVEPSPTGRWTTSRGGYGSVMEGDGSLAPNTSCAAPPSGGYSIGGRSVSSLQSRGGYGSVMEGDGSLAPNTSCAAPPSGGYSIGGRSVSSLQSRGGYGSVMEGDGSLAPNTSCAAPPSGGYSIGGRSVSSLQSRDGYSFACGGSFSGSASFVSVNMREKMVKISSKVAGSLVTALSGHSCGARLSCASEQCDRGVPESTIMSHRPPNAVSPRAGKVVEGDIASLVAQDAVFRAGDDVSRPLSEKVSDENQTLPAVAASEDTAVSTRTALRGSGVGSSEMLSSTMDPVELTAALQRLGERQTLCWEENTACTFGEVGCHCATGKGHIPIIASTKQAPRQPRSAPVGGAEARAHGVGGIVVRSSPTENTLAAASPNAASPVPLLLGEKLLNDTVQHENHQLKSRYSCAGVCPRSNGPQAHVGARFRLHPSPAPVRGTANVSAQQVSANASNGSPPDTITGTPTKSTSQERCENGNQNHAGSVLDGDGFTSGVTILSEPRSSADLSVHKLPDASALRGDVRIQQLRERQCADSAVASHCRARYPMPAATSILHNSRRSSRINESEKPKATERTEASAAAVPGVSYYGDLTVSGSATAADNVAMRSIPPFPLPPDATVVNPAADAIDEEPLRMPHNMTGVLLGGGNQSGRFSGMQAAQETAAVAHDPDATGAVEDSCEVPIRHANLTTLLAHSRLDSSHVIVNRASVLEAPVVAARPGLANAGRLRSVEVSRSEKMALDDTAAGETHAGRSDALCENAPSAGSDRDGCGDSEGACNTRKYTPLAEGVAERRIAHGPPLHPSKCRRTILDIADVPYVDSPDVSMHTDMREALRKKKERDVFVMRWAQRGLLWQRQENEAQRYEEYQCRVAAGKGFSGGAAANEAKPILHGELVLHGPGQPNRLRPPEPMQPRAHGYPPPRRHH
ncbi:hypothetical protein GH5_08579 [Leishmania sp. Ghana 2012 LV757]|uniref:uncharacterized protein n=1 Tax=Leishmania sp. Ghana 2012 LV757 TaxID=2803181 RepID=UPI001B554CF9|nr:hypothetical protein GH5_08579 [Leishmania sp. Ghana 2012 LV757]